MIPLAIPNITGKEGEYLAECIRTRYVSSIGPFVTRFENDVARASGSQAAVAVCSGTAGLHVALVAAGVQWKDLVICPSFTFIATANAVTAAGASPWLFDINPRTWTINTALLERALASETERRDGVLVHRETGRRVSAIMPVHTLGLIADMDQIRALSRRYRLPVVVDAAAALGATYKGRAVGELADLSVFSFNGNKTVTAGGGGAVVGTNSELVGLARHLSTTARISSEYEHDRAGFNYRMTNLQAAVGCAQMERLEEFVTAKRRIRARYDSELKQFCGVLPFPIPQDGESACWFSGFVFERGSIKRTRRLCKELEQLGVEARTFWRPVHMQGPYREAPKTDMHECESLWERIVTLPCSTAISAEEQDKVCHAIGKLLR